MAIKLISVSEEFWGKGFPKSLPALAQKLLGPRVLRGYEFTGKQRPRCKFGMTVVFRYDGFLLGEGVVNHVSEDGRTMFYRPTRIVGLSVGVLKAKSEFVTAGRVN